MCLHKHKNKKKDYKLIIKINTFFFRYFCHGPKPGEKNLISEMEKCGLWQDILGARNLVAHHSDSLIHFVNNNCVES